MTYENNLSRDRSPDVSQRNDIYVLTEMFINTVGYEIFF